MNYSSSRINGQNTAFEIKVIQFLLMMKIALFSLCTQKFNANFIRSFSAIFKPPSFIILYGQEVGSHKNPKNTTILNKVFTSIFVNWICTCKSVSYSLHQNRTKNANRSDSKIRIWMIFFSLSLFVPLFFFVSLLFFSYLFDDFLAVAGRKYPIPFGCFLRKYFQSKNIQLWISFFNAKFFGRKPEWNGAEHRENKRRQKNNEKWKMKSSEIHL